MMTQAAVRKLVVEHYNRSEQADDPVAYQTRIALCEYAALLEDYERLKTVVDNFLEGR